MLTKAFWVLIALTAAMVVLTALGWAVMPVLAVLIIVDIIVIEATRRADMKSINNDLAHTIAARFDSLDKLCSNISSSVTASRDDILRALGKEPPVRQEEQVPIEGTPSAEAVIEPADIEEEKQATQETPAAFALNFKQD